MPGDAHGRHSNGVILAHLSDLHLRNEDDAAAFATQLDRVVVRHPDHLVITGDLLDRWNPALLGSALDRLAARGFLDAERLTVLHGNHDLASSGGHPRGRADLRRLITRFWDPPPILAARRRAFYRQFAQRSVDVAGPPPFAKVTRGGLRLAVVDSVPAPWRPLGIRRGALTVRHGEGAIARGQLQWLSQQRGLNPLVVLVHHYPLPVAPFEFDLQDRLNGTGREWWARLGARHIVVPMEIEPDSRTRFWEAASGAGATLIACGHVHRARLEHHQQIAVGLNGQSGAPWAGRTIAYYRIEGRDVTVEYQVGSGAPSA
jgi:3',5'-cyclic AMP phosphodiesterase CpdA